MGKRDIPIPRRPDEFTNLETELLEAIENIEKHTRAVEDMLVSYAEAGDEISDEPSVGDETTTLASDQNGDVQPEGESSVDEATSQARDENENGQPDDDREMP